MSERGYGCASEFCAEARIRLNPETLDGWCEANPFLSAALRTDDQEYRLDRAEGFRQIWMEAERQWREEGSGPSEL